MMKVVLEGSLNESRFFVEYVVEKTGLYEHGYSIRKNTECRMTRICKHSYTDLT